MCAAKVLEVVGTINIFNPLKNKFKHKNNFRRARKVRMNDKTRKKTYGVLMSYINIHVVTFLFYRQIECAWKTGYVRK